MGLFGDLLYEAKNAIEDKVNDVKDYMENTSIERKMGDLGQVAKKAGSAAWEGTKRYIKDYTENPEKYAEKARRNAEFKAREKEREYYRNMKKVDKAVDKFNKDMDKMGL